MFFVAVMMLAQRVQKDIGLRQSGDVLGRKEGRQTFLPEVVRALDFALGLRSGSKAERDLVKTQGGAQLSKGVALTGEEEGMVIDVKSQWETMGKEGAREQIEVSEQ